MSGNSLDFPQSYTGRIWDADANLYNYRARWYDAAAGRFISEDPIGFNAGDPNLYRYCNNSPVIMVDPSGLCWTGLSNPGELVVSGSSSWLGLSNDYTVGSSASKVVLPGWSTSSGSSYVTPSANSGVPDYLDLSGLSYGGAGNAMVDAVSSTFADFGNSLWNTASSVIDIMHTAAVNIAPQLMAPAPQNYSTIDGFRDSVIQYSNRMTPDTLSANRSFVRDTLDNGALYLSGQRVTVRRGAFLTGRVSWGCT